MRDDARVGYVLKRYPRLSETFIVSELLGREEAGEELAVARALNDLAQQLLEQAAGTIEAYEGHHVTLHG